MTSEKPHNPPAFPIEQGHTNGTWNQTYDPGMTLREYLAAHAPVTLRDAMIACGFSEEDEIATLRKDETRATVMAVLALMRWEYADAMLIERTKPS